MPLPNASTVIMGTKPIGMRGFGSNVLGRMNQHQGVLRLPRLLILDALDQLSLGGLSLVDLLQGVVHECRIECLAGVVTSLLGLHRVGVRGLVDGDTVRDRSLHHL